MKKSSQLTISLGALFLSASVVLAQGINPNNLTLDQRVAQLESQIQQDNAQHATTSEAAELKTLKAQVALLQEQVTRNKHVLQLMQQRMLELMAMHPVNGNQAQTQHFVANQAHSPGFDEAYGAVVSGNYKAALAKFSAYIKQNPKGALLPEAYYWLGEINMLQGNSSVAVHNFRKVVNGYPHSERAPDALRQLGALFLANGDSQHAKTAFERVIKHYPNSPAASVAKQTLASMK